MAITVPQNQAVTNAYSGNFGSNVTAGNTIFLLVVGFSTSNVVISSSSPTFGGSPVTGAVLLKDQQSPFAAGQTNYSAIWMMPNVAGGATSFAITVTNGTSSGNTGIWALEVAGLGAAPAADQTVAAAAATGTVTATTGNITQAPEIVMAAAKQAATSLTGPGVWTDQTIGTAITGYQIAGSSGSGYTFAPGGSGGAEPWSEVIATVYAGSGSTTANAGAGKGAGVAQLAGGISISLNLLANSVLHGTGAAKPPSLSTSQSVHPGAALGGGRALPPHGGAPVTRHAARRASFVPVIVAATTT